jgi:murein DD-endopeptidase MepM/ murein hydrolase activator NlpD
MKKKENKLQKFLKTGILLFGISLLLWNCEKEEILDLPLKKNKIETVSIASAKELFEEFNNQKNNLFSKGRKQFNFDPLWETINQEELSFSKALLTNLEIKPSKKLNYKPKLFFININGYDIKAFETTIAEQVFNNGKIKEGTVFYHSIQGSFMTGYRIKNGKTVRILKKKPTMNKASFLSFLFPQSNFWDGLDGIEGGVFDEVVILGPRGESMSDFMAAYNSSGEFFIDDDITGGGGDDGGGGGGGGDSGNKDNPQNCLANEVYNSTTKKCECITGYVKDANGNCVKKPCVGDPVKNPEIAPQKGPSGKKGAMFGNAQSGGCTRYGSNACSTPRNKKHDGIDIKNAIGNNVYVMNGGFIYSSGYSNDYGYYAIIQSTINGKTILTTYAHMQKENRIEQNKTGQPLVGVNASDVLGIQGDTGNIKDAIADGSVEPHVQIENKEHDGSSKWNFKENFNLVDPRTYLSTIIDNNGISQTNTNCN